MSGIEKSHFVIYAAGPFPGAVISRKLLEKAQEAERKHEEKDKDDDKPPKPPRGRSASIGKVAIAYSPG